MLARKGKLCIDIGVGSELSGRSAIGQECSQRQLEHRVNSSAPCIKSGDAGWSYNRKTLVRALTQTAQERSLTGARLTRKKNMCARAIDKSSSGFNHIGLVLCSFHTAKKQRRKKTMCNKLFRNEIQTELNLPLWAEQAIEAGLHEVQGKA